MSLEPLEPASYPYFDYRRFTFSLGMAAPEGVWLSGSTAVRHDAARNAMLVDGDLVAQAEIIFDKMRLALEAGGRKLTDLTHLVRYVTPDALGDIPALDARQAQLLGAPFVTTIVVRRLLREEALIEMEASISHASGISSLPAIFAEDGASARAALDAVLLSDGLRESDIARLAQFVVPGGSPVPLDSALTVVSPRLADGTAAVQLEIAVAKQSRPAVVYASAHGDPAFPDIADQCREAYGRIASALEAAGSGLARVIKTTEFIAPAGLPGYRSTAAVRRDLFTAPYPAATGVVCEGFGEAGTLIAIEAVARMNST